MADQVELQLIDDGAENTFQKRKRWGGSPEVVRMKRYDVLLDGQKVGEVKQDLATFERKPRGSRIVSRRWHNVRWFYELDNDPAFRRRFGQRRSSDYETRKRAVESMLWHRKDLLKDAAQADPSLEFIDV